MSATKIVMTHSLGTRLLVLDMVNMIQIKFVLII